MMIVRSAGLVLALILLAACSSAARDERVVAADEVTEDGAPVPLDLDALIGSSWTLRFGGGPLGDVQLVDGWPITITFDEGSLGGTAACNGYGSAYVIEGSQLRLEGVGKNDAGCLPEVQEAEAAYLAALDDVDGINLLEDELALSGPSTELLFIRNEPVPSDGLVGQLWLLEALVGNGETSVPEGEPATLILLPDGTLGGGTGCRLLTGAYVIYGNEVLFSTLSAEGDCPSALSDQDSHVVGVLGDGFVPAVEGDELRLTSAGNEELRYRAISEDELAGLSGTGVLSDAELLDGVEWIFAGGDSPNGPIDDPRSVEQGRSIDLVFSDGAYSGTAVCNRYGGEAEIGNGRLSLGTPASEEEGCGEPFHAIASAYYEAIPLMTEFGLESDGARLVVNGSDIELWFERAGP